MITQNQIQELHRNYCSLTGITIPLTMQRIYQWEAWGVSGWTRDDLALVIRHLKEKIRRGQKTISCLRFGYLIGNTEWFGEDLGEAQAVAKNQVRHTPRESVLRATCRETQMPDKVRTAEQIMAGNEALKALLQLRASL